MGAFNDSVNITICPNKVFEGGMSLQTSCDWNGGLLGEKTERIYKCVERERRREGERGREREREEKQGVVDPERSSRRVSVSLSLTTEPLGLFCLHVVLSRRVR